jgi:hypothetical protein
MFVREFGLVPNRDDSERFVRLVRWEVRWRSIGSPDWEDKTLVPVAWEYRVLERRDPERGISWHAAVPVVITELRMRQLAPPVWPREANHEESETLRRSRIRLLRKACHVDADKGSAEPEWLEPDVQLARVDAKVKKFSAMYGTKMPGFDLDAA